MGLLRTLGFTLMAFTVGPIWTDPRPGSVHLQGESFPLLPSAALSSHEAPELHVFPDAEPQPNGMRSLFWTDWGQVLAALESAFPSAAATFKVQYGITGTMKWKSWARDHIHLCRDLVHEVRDFMVANKPAGSTFKQDPADAGTWGFYL